MQGSRRTTLKDIAARTGFSVNTVSVALRGGAKVPPATRELIVAAARDLNYTPNALARSLARKSSGTVGLVINNLQNPILTEAADHIQLQLEANGYQALLRSTGGDLERERRAVESLQELQVEGILIYPAHHREVDHLRALRAAGMPLVMLAGPVGEGIDLIAVDDRTMTMTITRHLIDLGHRHIGLMDISHTNGNFAKIQGFLDAHEAAGIAVDPKLVFCPVDHNLPDCGYRRAGRLLGRPNPPTALVCTSDVLAVGVMSWCRENGVDIPRDLSLTGLDDISISAHLPQPLTTMHYSVEQVSQLAVARLVDMMTGGGRLPEPVCTMIAPALVLRASTGPARAALAPVGQMARSEGEEWIGNRT